MKKTRAKILRKTGFTQNGKAGLNGAAHPSITSDPRVTGRIDLTDEEKGTLGPIFERLRNGKMELANLRIQYKDLEAEVEERVRGAQAELIRQSNLCLGKRGLDSENPADGRWLLNFNTYEFTRTDMPVPIPTVDPALS